MKTIFFSFIFLFYFNFTLGQTKTIYVNENLELISEEEFNKSEISFNYLYSQFTTDTLIVKTKAKRDNRGQLTDRIYNRIKDNINFISSDKKISENDIIIINYYPGLDECNNNSGNDFLKSKYADYSKKVNEITNVKQFYFYKEIGNISRYGKKLKWYEDPHRIFEKLFFKIHYPCGSYLIIFPDKTYVSYFGEYNLDDIFDELQFKKKLDKKNQKN